MPGLVNAHCHSSDNFLRGRHERLPLEQFMLAAATPWGLDAPADERMTELRVLVGAAECLLTGTTALFDDCFQIGSLNPATIDAVMRAYERIGIRAHVAFDLSDLPFDQTVSGLADELTAAQRQELRAPFEDWRAALAVCEDAIERHNLPGGRLRVGIAASSPERCSDQLLEGVAAAAERFGLPWCTHVLESRAQAITGHRRYGETIVAHLARLGVLTPAAVLAHCVWLTDGDIELLAAHGVTVAHNPSSNLRLGSGLAPIAAMLERGIPVALGTDGVASNDAQNLFLELRLAASLHGVDAAGAAGAPSADQAFEMATLGGARAFGDERLGEVTVGGAADLVLLDGDGFTFLPGDDPIRSIAYSEYGQSVRTVIVDGAVVVRDGELLTIDLAATMAEARDACRHFLDCNRKAFRRYDEFAPAVERALERMEPVSYPASRRLG